MIVYENIIDWADELYKPMVVRAWLGRTREGPHPRDHRRILIPLCQSYVNSYDDPLSIAVKITDELLKQGVVVNAIQVSGFEGCGSLEYRDWP